MAQEFRLPDIGEGLVDAELVSWRVAVGDHVTVDQPLAEVETAKSMVEIPSPFTGTVLQLGAAEGETVSVGAVLVVIGDAGESLAERQPAGAARTSTPAAQTPGTTPAPIVGSLSEVADDLTPVAVTPAQPSKPRALPLVRKLATRLGVDIASVPGSGPHGRITRQDVEAAAARVNGDSRSGAGDGDERRPISRLRRTIAANLAQSWSQIPQATAFTEVDATRLLELRRSLAARRESPVPMDALLVACAVPALRAHPELNASVDGNDLVLHRRQDIGVAVDSPDGLMVGVVRDAASQRLGELCDEVLRLSAGVRDRTLPPSDLSGQTFTVSNIGAVGGGYGVPIVPPDTVAILSVGRAKPQPVALDGELTIRPMMPLSLSYDHRVVDGGLGRRFLATLTDVLAEPALMSD